MPNRTIVLINHTNFCTQVAVLNSTNNTLMDFFVENGGDDHKVGDIFLGKVVRLLLHLGMAFVDIGLNKLGFLNQDDTDLTSLHDGQFIVVQVSKEAFFDKSVRLTTRLSLPSRHLVYYPKSIPHIGISHKITDKSQKSHLKSLLSDALNAQDNPSNSKGAWVIRTHALGVQGFVEEVCYLQEVWQHIYKNATNPNKKISKLYSEAPVYLSYLRDLAPKNVEIWVNDERIFDELNRQRGILWQGAVHLYSQDKQMFDAFLIKAQINALFAPKIPLKSGANLIVEHTEAMTVIDVNSGAATTKYQLADINLQAAYAVIDAIKLRKISGLIVVDFIDNKNHQQNQALLTHIKQAFASDTQKMTVLAGPCGLVVIVRERTQGALFQKTTQICPTCGGTGRTKSLEMVCFDILQAMIIASKNPKTNSLTVMAHADVIDFLQKNLQQVFDKVVYFNEISVQSYDKYQIITN